MALTIKQNNFLDFLNYGKSNVYQKLLLIFIIPLIVIGLNSSFAEPDSQTLSSDNGTIDVKLSYDDIVPGDLTILRTDFINPQTQKIQQHVDWWFEVSKDNKVIWGPTQLSHTSEGSLKNLKYQFEENGKYKVKFGIEGILFQPIPLETTTFDVVVGEDLESEPVKKIPEWVNNTMQWYLDGVISEDEMISAIQFLVQEGIIILE